jgi:hypothetical protein
MLGRQELDKLSLQKQALLLQSSLNRVALQEELRSLRSATTWVRGAGSLSREFAPLLVFLAPLAGFLLARGASRRDSWFGRIVTVVKWIGPLYGLWKRYLAGRQEPEAGEPAA